MESQMQALTLEQQQEVPHLIQAAAAKIRGYIASSPQEIEIIRPGEFCRSPDFCDEHNLDTVTLILKVEKGGPSPFRAEFLSRAGEEALMRSINFNDDLALERAIAYGSLAVYHLEKNMPERGIVISAFARTLRQRRDVSSLEAHLDEVIYYFEKTLEIEPPEEENRPFHLEDHARALLDRYKAFHREEDFVHAQRSFELAVDLRHAAEPNFLSGLGQLLMEKSIFEKPGEAAAFDDSIDTLEKAIQRLTKHFRGSVGAIYYYLGIAYAQRYKANQCADDWKKAEMAFTEVISRLKPPSLNHVSCCHGIARCYSDIFDRYGRLEDSTKGEEYYKLALISRPEDPIVLTYLAENLRCRAYRTSSTKLLEESIQLIGKAVQSTPMSAPELPFRLGRRANALSDRFALTGNIDDIDQAIVSLESCLDATGLKEKDGWMYLKLLAHACLLRYDSLLKKEDLQKAETAINRALGFEELTSSDRSGCLRVSGKVLFGKYRLDREPKFLDEAIGQYKESIRLSKMEELETYTTFNDLGNALLERAERSASNADIQAAATSYREALEKLRRFCTVPTSNEEGMLLHGLGNVELRQYQLWSQTGDLDAAIKYYKKSHDLTLETNVRYATRTGSLSWALQERFDVAHKVEDLREAERRLEYALALPLKLSPSEKSYLENRMGMIHLRFFFHTEDMNYLKPAEMHFQNALATGCTEKAYLKSASNNLAVLVTHRLAITKDLDIIATYSQIVPLLQSMKETDSELGKFTLNLAELFSIMYDLKKDPFHGRSAVMMYLTVIKVGRIAPQTKINATMKAARLAFDVLGDAQQARNLLKAVIDELPGAILVGMNRGDQLRIIRECSWLPRNITGFCIAAGDPAEEALRCLENSRSIIWNNLLNEQSDLGPLEVRHPQLARRYEVLRTKLTNNTLSKFSDPDPAIMLKMQENHQACLQYYDLLTEIRGLEGFDSFLRIPREASSLTAYASKGPVVIITSSEFRSDCLIIQKDGVVALPLPEMTQSDCLLHSAHYLMALDELQTHPQEASTKFEKVLIWLWKAVGQPVMEKLGFLGPNKSTSRPRVWWMTTGWLGILPIHAAGDHRRALETGEPLSLLDLTTPSYFNSLRSLGYARERISTLNGLSSKISSSSSSSSSSTKALLVQMPTTPDRDSLPHAGQEVSMIQALLQSQNINTSILTNPNRDDVLKRLKSCGLAHLACHGTADPDDPSLSKLLLQDWKSRPLNVRALLRTKEPTCKLVVLSACETAVSKDRKLLEEGIHLAGGFQMMGVPHVVGTLWKVEDAFSVEFLRGFYHGIIHPDDDDHNGILDVGLAAESLRNAALDARSKGVDALTWGAYVHSGP